MLSKYLSIIEKTKKKFIKVETINQEDIKLNVFESKIGGIPYWSKGQINSYPLINKTPMKLMWQINFNDLKEYDVDLDLPKSGILQCFVQYKDDLWGLEFDENVKNQKIKMIYHETIGENEIITGEIYAVNSDTDKMPWDNELKLKFSKEEEFLGLMDEYATSKNYDFIEQLDGDEEEYMYNEYMNSGSKIGGYAYFTQSDPRMYNKNISEDYELLFQIDTDDNLMWGDSGVGNWFIKNEDLKNKNFSNVFYNWDCC